ncbi:MAG TPA: zf-HC2 domain-containing protein [Thermoanaerobaculia bacterium]|nr:zf-HC2 domain-containing protein [Thermoanaerobaculia bacterium]
MDHTEATAEQLVERYMLDELDDEKAERFEEHYFECGDCASELRSAVTLMRYGREVAAQEPEVATNVVPITAPPRFRSWLATAAAAVIGFVVAVPLFRVSPPAVPAAAPVVMSVNREVQLTVGEARTTGSIEELVVGENEPLNVLVDVAKADGATAYELTVRTTGGTPVSTERVHPDQVERGTVSLNFNRLPAGTYEVVTRIVGADGRRTEANVQTFKVTLEEGEP